MAHATDIAAYTYKAAIYSPEQIIGELTKDLGSNDRWLPNVEAFLDLVALLKGIDRTDESSFDSDDFPKVVFSSQLEDEGYDEPLHYTGTYRCRYCHEPIRHNPHGFKWENEAGLVFCQVGTPAFGAQGVWHEPDDDSDDVPALGPDDVTHAFRTLWGMPPDKDDVPACGAQLSDNYDFPATKRPPCPECAALLAAEGEATR